MIWTVYLSFDGETVDEEIDYVARTAGEARRMYHGKIPAVGPDEKLFGSVLVAADMHEGLSILGVE